MVLAARRDTARPPRDRPANVVLSVVNGRAWIDMRDSRAYSTPMSRLFLSCLVCCSLTLVGGCATGGGVADVDAGSDAGNVDAGSLDATMDAANVDGASPDLGATDAGADAWQDGGVDMEMPMPDASTPDAGTPSELLGMAWTPTGSGGGSIGVYYAATFRLEFASSLCGTGPLGDTHMWATSGTYDFTAVDDPDYEPLVECLLDGFDQTIAASAFLGTSGGGNTAGEVEAFGTLPGHTIDFIRVVVVSLTIANDGSYTTEGHSARWEIWGH